MKTLKRLPLILLVGLITACSDPVWSDGDYEIYYFDGFLKLGIALDDGWHERVDHHVIAVGSDEKFLVVKQLAPQQQELNFYYIDRTEDNKYLNPDEITQGPFDQIRFEQLRVELNLPDFDWHQNEKIVKRLLGRQ